MSRPGLILIALLLAAAPGSPEPPRSGGVRLGMTAEQVTAAWGPPAQVSRQVLFRRHIEQWRYANPARRVEFNCVHGERPYAIGLQVER